MDDLQKCQNDMIRIITGNTLLDKVRVADMLDSVGFMSVNRMLAYSMLMESWKAINLHETPLFNNLYIKSEERLLRSTTDRILQTKSLASFPRKAAMLWRKTSDSFRKTNLITVAQKEAKSLAMSLPL